MINKKYRLKKNYEFNHVYRKGTSVASKQMVMYSVKNKLSNIKIGFSVSKKIGISVQRNKAKRLMREAARSCISQFKKGYNYIIVARNFINESTLEQIQNSLIYMLKKAERIS